jgi:hypothetical protein
MIVGGFGTVLRHRLHGRLRGVEDDAPMFVAHQAADNVGAHPPKTNDTYLHPKSPAIREL